ncbi:MAG: glycosyltransferase, partial [Candidatus Altiarchaeota archaeon]
DKVILYIGRFEKEKNLPFLLQAFANVKKKCGKAKLVLVGSGKEKKNLEDIVWEMKLEDVVFLKPLAPESVPLILNCANVFAITSQYESCPLVAQEALACGIPVVSVDVGRVKEMINSSCAGAIVERNPDSMAEALVAYLEKKQGQAKTACRKSVSAISFDKTIRETLKVYEKALLDFSG